MPVGHHAEKTVDESVVKERSTLRALGLLLCAAGLALCAAGAALGAAAAAADRSERSAEPDPVQLIQRMFPQATRIGDKDYSRSIPVWPVYQVTQLIGYAYESLDLLKFPGFSGEPMNFLIGVDNEGTLRGVDVLYHHEPIFIYGLGPQPFVDFLNQYPGHSITEQIVLGKSPGARDNNVTYFDGISAATVTLAVANDTVLLSAMQVARDRLEAFAQRAPARVREAHFERLSWDDLLRRGLVQRWSLPRDEVEQALGSRLSNYDDPDLRLALGDAITLYYAYLNPPSVGRNLLGEAGYARLRDTLSAGEHAFAVFSQGFYPYLPEDFTPASTPDRIAVLQNGLPIAIRDTNFVDIFGLHLLDSAPTAENLRIFRTRAQAGLDPSQGTQLQLMVELRKNPLVTDSATFRAPPYRLPASFFERIDVATGAAPPPVWTRVWASRRVQTGLILAALGILTVAFAMQRRLAANALGMRCFRAAFLAFTLLFIGIYAQGQLSVVNIFAIQLALRDGFKLDVFLLDPVIFVLWIYTFVSLFVVGRGLFCGWLCPFGALQSMLAWIAGVCRIRPWRLSRAVHSKLIYVKYVVLAALMALAMFALPLAERGAEVEPFKTAITLRFVREWPFVLYAALLLGAGLFINKFYCRYLCPLGAGLAILGRLRLFSLLPRRAECGSPCQLCAVRCETAAIGKNGAIDYNECVQCLDCAVILHDDWQCAPRRAPGKRRRQAAVIPVRVAL